MDWPFLLGLLTAIGAIVGWFVLHVLEGRRSRENTRRELITNFLIDAYRRLEANANRPRTNAATLESAIADIQLFGSPRQIELIQEFAIRSSENDDAAFDDILILLREDLRKELRLAWVPRKLLYYRWISNEQG